MREHGAVYIPDDEYLERVKRAAKILQREGLDASSIQMNLTTQMQDIFQASGRYLKDVVLRFLRQEMRH